MMIRALKKGMGALCGDQEEGISHEAKMTKDSIQFVRQSSKPSIIACGLCRCAVAPVERTAWPEMPCSSCG
jgi:hypothetical protein